MKLILLLLLSSCSKEPINNCAYAQAIVERYTPDTATLTSRVIWWADTVCDQELVKVQARDTVWFSCSLYVEKIYYIVK